MKKKIIVMLVMIAIVATMLTVLCTACDSGEDFKIGLICLHDENSTYDFNFISAMKNVQEELGLKDSQVIIKTGIPEGAECYDAAADLVDQGCDIIFADSFGHEAYMIQAAKEFPSVQFCHATGTKAHTEGLSNFHNAFASIYEGRYLAGIAAGMKLQAMMAADASVQPIVGYVGAWQYAEVISGYTSFFLGIRSIVPTATMKVQFTSSWYDETKEKAAANALIGEGCVLISQHADSMGAPTACETAGVPNVSYNGSTKSACPTTFIVSSKINWAPYYKYAIEATKNGTEIAADWTGTIATGSVQLTDVNADVAAAGTQEAIDAAKAKFADGSLKVFDTSKFTVGGLTLTSKLADVDDAGDYVAETEAIVTEGTTSYYAESSKRSAPYFDLTIDGISLLNAGFGD